MSKKQFKQELQEYKKTTKKLTKQDELQEKIKEFKNIAISLAGYGVSSEEIAEKGGKQIQKLHENQGNLSDEEKHSVESEIKDTLALYNKANSLNTSVNMLNAIEPEQRGMAIEIIKELKQEYCVKKAQDKIYLQIATNAICRYYSNMSDFEHWKRHDWNSHERVAYMGMLSKDTDKAFRQYNSVIQYFEGKKQPPIKVNVKANNAFVAQNQQFNNNDNEKDTR